MMAELLPEPAPRSQQIGTATGLSALHNRADEHGDCVWCFRRWPCPDRRWASRILRLARQVRRE